MVDEKFKNSAEKCSVFLIKFPHPTLVLRNFENKDSIDTEDLRRYAEDGQCGEYVIHVWCDVVRSLDENDATLVTEIKGFMVGLVYTV